MGRPKGGTNRQYSFEEKLIVVKRYQNEHKSYNELAKETGIHFTILAAWVKHYIEEGEAGLKPKKKGNPHAAIQSKSLSDLERLKLEKFKLKVENERLKKGYTVKGVGSKKVYVTLSGKIIKSPSK